MSRRRFGYVRRLPSGRWQASYVGPDGMRYPGPGTFGSRRDAERWLSVAESEILRGTWLAAHASTLTVAEWVEQWWRTVDGQLKRTTSSTYRSLLRTAILPAFGNRRLRDLRPVDVGRWLSDLTKAGYSPSWVCKAYRLLSQILKAATENDLIAVNPCRGHRLPRLPEPNPTILTEDEVARIVEQSARPFDLVVLVLAYTGVRIGEALALRRGDVVDGGMLLLVDERQAEPDGVIDLDTPKAHQRRRVAVPAFLAARLVEHLDEFVGPHDDARLFTGRGGVPLRYGSWRRWKFVPAIRAVGLDDVTPHDLRATHGTWVADRHGVMAAAARLGHSNANVTTRHYARAVDGRDAEIAAAFDASWLSRSVTVKGGQSGVIARGSHDDNDEDERDGLRDGRNGA